MAISMNGIGNFDLAASKTKSTSRKNEGGFDDTFASFMNTTGNVSADNSTGKTKTDSSEYNKTDKPMNSDNKLSTDKINSGDKDKSQDYNIKSDDKVNGADDKVKADDVSDNNKILSNDVSETDKLDDAGAATTVIDIMSALRELIDGLQDMLGVSNEEINDMLQTMEMEISDLLNEDNLKSFVLNLQGLSEIDVLLNEDIAGSLDFATDLLDKVMNGYGVTPDYVEELGDMVNERIVNELNGNEIQEIITSDTDENVGQNVAYREDEQNKESLKSTVISQENNYYNGSKTDGTQNGETNGKNVNHFNSNDDITNESVQSFDSYADSGDNNGFGNSHQNIMTNLNQAIEQAMVNEADGASSYVESVQQADIVRQLIDNIRVNITKDATAMQLQLNPENLGRVQINVVSKNGVMQAQITAETEAAKNAIEAGLETLKEAFNNQEIKVEAVEVTVASYDFFNQSSNGDFGDDSRQKSATGSNSLNVDDEIDENELSEGEQIELDMMKTQGNRVSYSI